MSKTIKYRVGTCRSGKPFDVPYNLGRGEIEGYLTHFEVQDRVDIFCMCEALIVSINSSEDFFADHVSIGVINSYFWEPEVFIGLSRHLKMQGLQSSPDYVRLGQSMLLLGC